MEELYLSNRPPQEAAQALIDLTQGSNLGEDFLCLIVHRMTRSSERAYVVGSSAIGGEGQALQDSCGGRGLLLCVPLKNTMPPSVTPRVQTRGPATGTQYCLHSMRLL